MKKFFKALLIIIAVFAIAFLLTSFKQRQSPLKSGDEYSLTDLGTGIRAPEPETLGSDPWELTPSFDKDGGK